MSVTWDSDPVEPRGESDAGGPDDGDRADITRRLTAEFRNSVPPEVVQRCVADVVARFDQAPVRAYIPVLVERIARDWLRDAVLESSHRAALRVVPDPTTDS